MRCGLKYLLFVVAAIFVYGTASAQIKLIPRERLDSVANPRTVEGAKMQFKGGAIVSFGTISEDAGKWQRSIEWRNGGDNTLVVTRVTTSCSCLQAVVQKGAVKAGDGLVVALTGLVFWDISRALYSGVAIFVVGKVVDVVVYSFDYSKVALIISDQHVKIAEAIGKDLNRGATFLSGQGAYTGKDTKVVLTAVKRQQLAELKQLVAGIDPNAFVIVQDAHQVLGDGFARYSKHSL